MANGEWSGPHVILQHEAAVLDAGHYLVRVRKKVPGDLIEFQLKWKTDVVFLHGDQIPGSGGKAVAIPGAVPMSLFCHEETDEDGNVDELSLEIWVDGVLFVEEDLGEWDNAGHVNTQKVLSDFLPGGFLAFKEQVRIRVIEDDPGTCCDDVFEYHFVSMDAPCFVSADGSNVQYCWNNDIWFPEPGNRFFMREDDGGKYSLSATVSRSIPPPQ